MRISKKAVLEYLESVYPVWKNFDQIADEIPVTFGFDMFELQDRLNVLCEKGKIEKEFPTESYLTGNRQRYRLKKEGTETPPGIGCVIQQIDALFRNYNRDTRAFTVDYDEETDGLYCHYTPYVNDTGYVVLDDFLFVGDTAKKDLQALKEYLDKNKIRSRFGCEWSVDWGQNEE